MIIRITRAAVFVPAKAGLFERPKAAFFTVVADGVMHRMTVGMVETTRRKTRFPTVGTTVHAKAKPPSATTAFCIYVITLASAIDNGENAKKKPPSNFILPPRPLNHLTNMLGEMSVGR